MEGPPGALTVSSGRPAPLWCQGERRFIAALPERNDSWFFDEVRAEMDSNWLG